MKRTMKIMKRFTAKFPRRTISGLLAFALFSAAWIPTAFAAGAGYTDVPQDSWAITAIAAAKDNGLMSGRDESRFGYGDPMTKAEFVTILCNLLKWQASAPAASSFPDVDSGSWYFPYVETALSHGVMDPSQSFQPNAPITRQEAAVMLIRALGLMGAAKLEEASPLPFTDVTENKGYISAARNIGMISGTSPTAFSPGKTAAREEIASMITQIYSRYYGKTNFLHGFYAISSYSQKELAAGMDAVTLLWSAMTRNENGVWLNTGADNGNPYKIPVSYEDATAYLDEKGAKAHLGVYMDAGGGVKELLLDADSRSQAVNAIVSELTRIYPEIEKNPYSGVTIDFEGLKGGDVKTGFNDFLTQLSAALSPLGKTLYVAVQPALPTGSYFDGFDYKTIGALADKVILMAHDYEPVNLSGFVGTDYYKNAALTPLSQVYYALKAATDPDSGVADRSKVTLAISFAAVGWQTGPDGKLVSESPIQASSQTIASLLAAPGTARGFSQTYRNPYITYTAPDGRNVFLWYEDSQSVFEKAALARLFGVNGVSLWRLGNIPDYPGYDATGSYK